MRAEFAYIAVAWSMPLIGVIVGTYSGRLMNRGRRAIGLCLLMGFIAINVAITMHALLRLVITLRGGR